MEKQAVVINTVPYSYGYHGACATKAILLSTVWTKMKEILAHCHNLNKRQQMVKGKPQENSGIEVVMA